MKIEKEYKEHNVFTQLDELIDFYNSLAFSIMSFKTQGTKSIINIDSFLFSSISWLCPLIWEVIK